jgi:hypothetical protein
LPEPRVASLTIDATGLGPCTSQWYRPCNYGIRVEGANGYDHRANFDWDRDPVEVSGDMRVTNGPVSSTGVVGDVPATLGPGHWTISFRLWYGSDAIQLVPVPGGTPRTREEDPFTAACSTAFDSAAISAVALHVHFSENTCTVETQLGAGS